MLSDTVHDSDETPTTEGEVLNFITMTEEEFRNLLRAVADEMRREHASRR